MKTLKKYSQYMYSYPHKTAYYSLNKENIFNAINSLNNTNISLYIHIPFCSTKCGYCNLFSIVTNSKNLIDEYINTICKQILQYSKILKNKNVNVNQIVFGGGTPFILSINHFDILFEHIENNFNVSIKKCGFDMETSPNETNLEKLLYLKDKGLKRLSIGIQSLQQNELNNIYRHHNVEQCYKALDLINKQNLQNFNIDLIYGIKEQTVKFFENSLLKALSFNPTEMFLYPLYIRKGTALYNKIIPNTNLQEEIYKYSKEILKEKGFIQTSMRRFSKNITENNESCGFEQTISIGCGGRSYLGNIHFCEPYEVNSKLCNDILKTYISKVDFTENMVGYILNEDEQKRRFIIKNLAFYKGLNLNDYKKHFSSDIKEYSYIFDDLYNYNFLEKINNTIFLTEQGIENSDNILTMFISESVNNRLNNVK